MRKQTKLVAVLSATALLAIGASMTSYAAQGWQEEGGTWVFYNKDGSMATDQWKKSGNNWYWLDSDGTMATDMIIEDDDDYYFVDANGVMVTNQWVQVDNVEDTDDDAPSNWWYYFTGNGKAYTANDSGNTALKTINGKKYAFTDEGKMLFGWVDESSTRQTDDSAWQDAMYYMGDEDDGAAAIGWAQIHVLDDTRNWDEDDEESEDQDYWFYFQSNGKKIVADDGEVKTKTINGKKYGFDDTGRMVFEWTQVSARGTQSTSSTAAVAGYNYFNDRDNGARVSKGWFKTVPTGEISQADHDDDEERWYYAYSVGKLCYSEFKTINGKRYCFDNSGRMLDGLQAVYTDGLGRVWNRKLDDEDLLKDGTELKNGGSTTLRLMDPAGLQQDGTITKNADGKNQVGVMADELDIDQAILWASDESKADGKGDEYGSEKSATFGVFYFGDDGAARTSTQTIGIDGDSYTFYFKKDGGRKGEGWNGIKDNYLYQNGKRVKADKDNKYEAYVIAPSGEDDLRTLQGKVEYLEYEGNNELISGQIYRVKSDVESVKAIVAAVDKFGKGAANKATKDVEKKVHLVNTSGSISKGNKKAKDGNEMYFVVEGGKVKEYKDESKE